jgi:hypothetical protein
MNHRKVGSPVSPGFDEFSLTGLPNLSLSFSLSVFFSPSAIISHSLLISVSLVHWDEKENSKKQKERKEEERNEEAQ